MPSGGPQAAMQRPSQHSRVPYPRFIEGRYRVAGGSAESPLESSFGPGGEEKCLSCVPCSECAEVL